MDGQSNSGEKKKLTIILPTDAKLFEAKQSGLFSRWKFYFNEYSKHFNVEIYSCDSNNFSNELPAKHYPIPFSIPFLPYANQILYNFYLMVKAPFMSEIIRVISVTFFSLPVIRLFRKKIILSYHFNYALKTKSDFKGLKALTSGFRENLSLKSANILTVTTKRLQEHVKKKYRIDSIIIPNFIDTERFFPNDNNVVNAKDNYILYAGRIYWHKGIDYLIEAFAEIRKKYSVKLKLAGSGDIIYYKEKVKKIGLDNIEFLGNIDNNLMPILMRKAKIFVLPTVNSEGHPKALIEAMASGCACIATKVNGNEELIDEGVNGLLAEPKNSLSLVVAIQNILDDSDLRFKLGENAVKSAKEFSLEKTLHKEIILVRNNFKMD